MEYKNLITFLHVVELGSFTKAAEVLGYSQPTISFQIKQLEDELGGLIFDRINHTITLTEIGHALSTYARQVRELTDNFKDTLTTDSEISGHIHVVTPDSVCEDMISKNYIDFHQKYPSISLKFTTADTTVMFDMLNRNEADIIMTLDRHVYHNDYIIAKEEHIPVHFVTNASSKFAGISNLSIKDIINEPFVLTEYGMGYRRVLDRELEKLSLKTNTVLEIGRTDLITTLLSHSSMISFLPDFVTLSHVDRGTLCYLDVCDIDVDIYKQLIYHKNKWLSRSLRTFIDYVKIADFSS